MLYELLSRVKFVASKRIDNLKKNIPKEELLSLLTLKENDEIADELICKIGNAIEPRGSKVGKSIALDMITDWNASLRYEYELKKYLHHKGIDTDEDMKIASKIAKLYGSKTMEIVLSNPYMLVRFFRWREVDTIGLLLLGKYDTSRAIGAVDYLIRNQLSRGHTCCVVDEFKIGASKLLIYNISDALLDVFTKHKRILIKGNMVHFYGTYILERNIINGIKEMDSSEDVFKERQVEQLLGEYDSINSFKLSTEQRDAVKNALLNRFYIIAGYAGTGKSTVLDALVYCLKRFDRHIEMAALSGKAALRMSQSANIEAKTIYRFLQQVKKSRKLKEYNIPIPENLSKINHKTTIILDEASMIGLGTMSSIMRYINENVQIILLGDDFQLPPIDFGLVFHKLVQSSQITSKLTKVYRQKGGNSIPIVGEKIRLGLKPELERYSGFGSGVSFFETNGQLNTNIIDALIGQLGGLDGDIENLQIISPTNKINNIVNAYINENRKNKNQTLFEKYNRGDIVVCNKNNYEKDIYNGMLGRVLSVDSGKFGIKNMVIDFQREKPIFLSGNEVGDLALGYCLTCHKLQGSQSKRVIVILDDSSMIEQTWLYTAITRAMEQVVVVGSRYQYNSIFARTPAYKRRRVGLSLDNHP
jgi:exodeoxyribonuclease V alpha subunit